MKKHGGNGNLYDKAAKSLDTPYTIIEDYAKELFANTARADVRVKQITIAESQRRRREGSELENVRLKLIVDRQRKVADNLQTLLQKRASQLVSTKKHASNDSIYEKAARNLDEPYTIIEEFTKELYSNSSRADIKRQQKVADDLKSLLQRKARQLSNECMSLIAVDSPRHHNIVNVLDVRGNLGDFQQLFRHLEAARQEVDVVFAANGLADMVATPSNIHIREGDDGKYLEAFSNKLLAFRLHAVTEALWSHFKSLEKHAGNGSLYQKAEKYIDESNTILEDFTMEMHSNTARADIKRQRREEAERENVRLKWIAERQQKVADSLSSLLKRRASQLMNDCASVVDGVEKHLGNGCIYEKAAKDLGEPYTVIEAFTKEMHSNNARADVKVKQVVRRYVEADHDLVIWVARVSPAEIRHKMLRGLTYILRGYAKL
ncbi:hypothetical protein PC129_g4251 [Phytophthora cactorum]|uniref:Uncharacterized protein n=1 Tax=Phytophthora cactorum TaxID=29920 RepID=A0A8T1IQ81_9STRA|nr:hypothetical protein PC129_g4251 [Phytophthora cactorum]